MMYTSACGAHSPEVCGLPYLTFESVRLVDSDVTCICLGIRENPALIGVLRRILSMYVHESAAGLVSALGEGSVTLHRMESSVSNSSAHESPSSACVHWLRLFVLIPFTVVFTGRLITSHWMLHLCSGSQILASESW